MAITFEQKYPTALKNAAWQKSKSFKDKAKAKTKTGLGEALTAAETAWGLIEFDVLIAAKQNLGGKSLAQKQTAAGKAHTYLDGPVKTAINSLEAASRKANETAKNTSLSTKAATAARTLSGALQQQAIKLHNIKLDDFQAETAAMQKSVNEWEHEHTEALHSMDAIVDDLKEKKDRETWEASHADAIIANAVKITKSLSDQTGDKHWKDNNDHWRRLLVAYAAANPKVKTLSPGRAAEEIETFADLVQHELGSIWH
jgi:hypothetical protein